MNTPMHAHWIRLLWVMVSLSALPTPGRAAVTITEAPQAPSIKNAHYEYVFDTSQGLKLVSLTNAFTKDNNLKDPTNAHLGIISLGAERYPLDQLPVSEVRQDDGRLTFLMANPSLECRLTIAGDDSAETTWTLSVTNLSGVEAPLQVAFPVFTGLVMGESLERNRFYHGLNGGMFGRQPVHLRAAYGYSFPILDVYDSALGGLYLISRDADQGFKGFEVIKKESGAEPKVYDEAYWEEIKMEGVFEFDRGCGMAVIHETLPLPAGERYETAPAIVGVHPGRWEKAWESYRDWLKSFTKPRSDVKWFRESFISKALHQGHYHEGTAYEWDKNIKPFDLNAYFDLNHWMDNRGDYTIRADWGGPDALKAELAKLRVKGIHTCLYLEACCLDPNSKIGQEHGLEWAVLNKGQRIKTEGNTEYNMCPGSGWREYLPQTVARVLRQSNTDAIYLDSLALRYWRCEDAAHDHPYRRGWHQNVREVLRRVGEAMDEVKPNTPLFCEFYSTGINARYMNGSYSPVVGAAQGITAKGFDFCKTGTNLYRFYFPAYKQIEITGVDEVGLGLSLFNGNGIHEFFNNPDQWPRLGEFCRVWSQNVAAFTSDTPEALVETGNDDIFMNRFPAGKDAQAKTVWTLWNGAAEAMNGAAVALTPRSGCHVIDLMTHTEVAAGPDGLKLDLPVGKVTVLAEMPARLKVTSSGEGTFIAAYEGSLKKPSLLVYRKNGEAWESKTVSFTVAEIPVNNNTVYDPNTVGGLNTSNTVTVNIAELFQDGTGQGLAFALLDGAELVDEAPARAIASKTPTIE